MGEWLGEGSHLVPKTCPGLQTDRVRICCTVSTAPGMMRRGAQWNKFNILIYMPLYTTYLYMSHVYFKSKFLLCLYRLCDHIFISPSLDPSSSPSSIKRHRSACNPASIGVSTKLILSNPRGVNPFAYGKRVVGRMQARADG